MKQLHFEGRKQTLRQLCQDALASDSEFLLVASLHNPPPVIPCVHGLHTDYRLQVRLHHGDLVGIARRANAANRDVAILGINCELHSNNPDQSPVAARSQQISALNPLFPNDGLQLQ